ncbi:hypothetical protein VTO42DRAFT_3190 [Malbranchea cinnamomea]
MGYFTFRWPHPAQQVYVTGTFDNWAQTVKLDRTDHGFSKEVELPDDKKIHYKFVVDGDWKTDNSAPQEDDGNHNINNYLLPHQLGQSKASLSEKTAAGKTGSTQIASVTMSGVTPESTTAGLAGKVPKTNGPGLGGPGAATVSSVAPESTTAQLAKDVPLEGNPATTPGTFPETPGQESEPQQFSVNPLPATAGIGNPIHLQPGEKVPNSATVTNNTLQSTATTDKAGYERDTSAPGMLSAPAAPEQDPFALPVRNKASEPTNGSTIQLAAPESTTAGPAGAVPLEERSSASTAPDVPETVRDSISRAHTDPEAAANEEAVEEKKEMERELLHEVPVRNEPGTPAPITSAATTGTAPASTQPAVGAEQKLPGDISPKTKEPALAGTTQPATSPAAGPPTSQTQPTTATGPETSTAPQTSTAPETSRPAGEQTTEAGKKKKRLSGLFSKLKEKMK